jgi:tRNA A37 threonylcarbamoyladenosine synthetase subunit TsaC/SUA5/YrdC
MEEYKSPLTCTSANVSGQSTLATTTDILAQFGKRSHIIKRVVDDGPRAGAASTVVRIIGKNIEVLREGSISTFALLAAAGKK